LAQQTRAGMRKGGLSKPDSSNNSSGHYLSCFDVSYSHDNSQ